jgi:hypothetical protein
VNNQDTSVIIDRHQTRKQHGFFVLFSDIFYSSESTECIGFWSKRDLIVDKKYNIAQHENETDVPSQTTPVNDWQTDWILGFTDARWKQGARTDDAAAVSLPEPDPRAMFCISPMTPQPQRHTFADVVESVSGEPHRWRRCTSEFHGLTPQ